jgi:hypothetical protein
MTTYQLRLKEHVGTTYKRALPRLNLGMDRAVSTGLGDTEAYLRTLSYNGLKLK